MSAKEKRSARQAVRYYDHPDQVPHEYDCVMRLYGSYVCSCPRGYATRFASTTKGAKP